MKYTPPQKLSPPSCFCGCDDARDPLNSNPHFWVLNRPSGSPSPAQPMPHEKGKQDLVLWTKCESQIITSIRKKSMAQVVDERPGLAEGIHEKGPGGVGRGAV